jgi:hypothetical protein
MRDLDGYIEVVEGRRREVARLILSLREFISQEPRRSFSAMLVAPPGFGKSFLVSRIAASLNLPYLTFNVTQMMRRENLTSCFDAIASAQAQDHGRIHIVFFDEISAPVEGLNIYDLFLTVLEEGTYLRGGQLFKLDPCIWLFADTEGLRDSGGASKEADFKSRLSLTEVSLRQQAEQNERIYGLICQGANQLQLQHGDVTKISAAVLKAFSCLDPEVYSNRRMRQLALKFKGIRYGEVRIDNAPEELRAALKAKGESVSNQWLDLAPLGDGDQDDRLNEVLVEIRRQPASV